MEIKKGIGVCPGVVIGTAIVLDAEDLVVPKRQVEASAVPAEIERAKQAIHASTADLVVLSDDAKAKLGDEIGKIFDFHLGMLKDKTVLRDITKEITTNRSTAEYAI